MSKILIVSLLFYIISMEIVLVKVKEHHPGREHGLINVDSWLANVKKYYSAEKLILINKACELARKFGVNCSPIKGETGNCYEQGITAAEILSDLGLDADLIMAAIVYYSTMYADLELSLVKKELGEKVSEVLFELQKLNKISEDDLNIGNKSFKSNSLTNLRKMLLAVINDVRVVLLKLAIHLVNMRVACNQTEEIKLKLAQEARELYAPLANRLGIGQLKWELEDLAFRFFEPNMYKGIASKLDEKRLSREKYIEVVIDTLSESLKKEEVSAELSGRAKHIYSIWRKMNRKQVGYDEIYDIRAIRVLVENVKDCYAVLGITHSLWHHIPKEFDDYITCPKENGYQALHTAVIGPEGKIIEVQIKTNKMHEQAELGVAAHWRYKEGGVHESSYSEKLNKLRQILNWQTEIGEGSLEDSAVDFSEDQIYVISPKGDVINLPKGATALDFAYHIHTDIGNRCRGAKVDGKLFALYQPLQSGSHVEVLTSKNGTPSRDWLVSQLKYVTTSKAKAKIKQWFKKQDREQNISFGKEIISREFKRLNVNNISVKEIVEKINFCATEEDLFAGLGCGDIKASQLLGAINKICSPLLKKEKKVEDIRGKQIHSVNEVVIDGLGELVFNFASCCTPIPGEKIIGYIKPGEGVSVHKRACKNILNLNDDKLVRLVEVSWGDKLNHNDYHVNIIVSAYNRQGMLKDVSAALLMEKINILAISTNVNEVDYIIKFNLKISLANIETLSRIITKLQQIPNVIEVFRGEN